MAYLLNHVQHGEISHTGSGPPLKNLSKMRVTISGFRDHSSECSGHLNSACTVPLYNPSRRVALSRASCNWAHLCKVGRSTEPCAGSMWQHLKEVMCSDLSTEGHIHPVPLWHHSPGFKGGICGNYLSPMGYHSQTDFLLCMPCASEPVLGFLLEREKYIPICDMWV